MIIKDRKNPFLTLEYALGILVCALFFTYWQFCVGAGVSARMALFFLWVSLLSVVVGATLLSIARVSVGRRIDFCMSLTLGVLVVNLALMLLAFVSPLPVTGNLALVIVLVAAMTIPRFLSRSSSRFTPEDQEESTTGEDLFSLATLAVCLLATTFWCRESLSVPAVLSNGIESVTVFAPWSDVFFHASVITAFGHSHGAGTLNNLLFSGQPLTLYHYASYQLPAALYACTGITAYQAVTGFWTPLGILLSGLAAYTLVRSWWGARAGFGATVAVILLPDPARMPWGSPWYSYHWLQAIAPGGAYGTAMAALAWLFVSAGCRQGRWRQVLAGGALAAFLALFKAQLAVAAAAPLAIWPWLFFRGISRRARVMGLLATLGLFAAMPFALAHISSAPDLRLGRKGAEAYLTEVRGFQPPNVIRGLLDHALYTPSYTRKVVFGVPFLLIAPFGLLLPAYPALLALTRRSRSAQKMSVPPILPEALLPLLTTVVFLGMTLLLPLNTAGFGAPDELLHRPFVWAYFALAAICGGLFTLLLPRTRTFGVGILVGVAAILLLVPLKQGRTIQHGPQALYGFAHKLVPTGLVQCCGFVRVVSSPTDIVQDTQNNYFEIVAGLAERTPYFTNVPSDRGKVAYQQMVTQRGVWLEHLKRCSSASALRGFSNQTGIRWVIMRPGDAVGWPQSIVSHPAFTSAGYRVYRLR